MSVSFVGVVGSVYFNYKVLGIPGEIDLKGDTLRVMQNV